MGNPLDPFASINQTLETLVRQKFDPRAKLIDERIRGQQIERFRSQAVSDVLGSIEIDPDDPTTLSNALRDLAAIDPDKFGNAFLGAKQQEITLVGQEKAAEALQGRRVGFAKEVEEFLSAKGEDIPKEASEALLSALGAEVAPGVQTALLKTSIEKIREGRSGTEGLSRSEARLELKAFIEIRNAMIGKATDPTVQALNAITEQLTGEKAEVPEDKKLTIPGVTLESIERSISERTQFLGVEGAEPGPAQTQDILQGFPPEVRSLIEQFKEGTIAPDAFRRNIKDMLRQGSVTEDEAVKALTF